MNNVIWCDSGWMPFSYGFCPSEKAWNSAIRRLRVTDGAKPYLKSGARCDAFENEDGHLVVLVTIHENEDQFDPIEIMSVLAHEAVHVFQQMSRNIGENEPSAEFEAYSVQNILLEIARAYFKTRNPNRFLPLQKSSVPEASRVASAKK